MVTYLARRLVMAIVTILLVALVVFLLIRSIPGDPVQLFLGDSVDPEKAAQLRAKLGLDRPVPLQFLAWLGDVAEGDLGQSIRTGLPVTQVVLEKFRVSAVLILVSVTLASLIAVPMGMIAAWRQNTGWDLAIVAGATFMLSIPSFWLGLLFLLFIGVKLDLLPVVGFVPFTEDFGLAVRYLVMPVATLTLIEAGVLTRMMRANTIEVLHHDYVSHARAKGASEARVLRRHVLPNAFAPTMTLIGLIVGQLLGGIAVVETVFTIPGLGKLLIDAIFNRDYPVIQGCLIFIAFCFIVVNLIVDLLYPVFDPRVASR